MARAILMSITLSVLLTGAADAAVIYNWRTLGGPEDVVLEGRIGFSDEAWRARRAEVNFTEGTVNGMGDQAAIARLDTGSTSALKI